jgi:hypothetical protein
MSAALEYTFFAMLLSGGAAAQTGPNVEPGLWQTRVETQLPDAPMATRTVTRRQCITREDLIPRTEQGEANCNVVENRVSGNTVRWRMRCLQGKAGVESNGTVIYSGEIFKGRVLSKINSGQQETVKITQTLSGHRVGACKGDQPPRRK